MFSYVPDNVLENPNLSPNAKLLYGIANGFITNNKPFQASNSYLAKILNCSDKTIKRCYKELHEANLIKVRNKGKYWDIALIKITSFRYDDTETLEDVQNCTPEKVDTHVQQVDTSVQLASEVDTSVQQSGQICPATHLYIKHKNKHKIDPSSLEEFMSNHDKVSDLGYRSLLVNHCDGNKEYLDHHLELIYNHIKAKALDIEDLDSYAKSWIRRNKLEFGNTPAKFKATLAKHKAEETLHHNENTRPRVMNQKPRKHELITDSKGRTIVRYLD